MRINTNIASMTAQENASNVNKNLSSSLEKLSSGLRINKAADDASGMAIADKLRTQASSLGQSISNANSANALVQIADKAMAEQSNILDIVKTKLIQASTDTTSAEGREAIRKDVSKLLEQLDNISNQTNYNGINLLNTAGQELSFQVGEKAEYDIGLTTAYAANTAGLGTTDIGQKDTLTINGATGTTGASTVNDIVEGEKFNITIGDSTVSYYVTNEDMLGDGSGTVTQADIKANVAAGIADLINNSDMGVTAEAIDDTVELVGIDGASFTSNITSDGVLATTAATTVATVSDTLEDVEGTDASAQEVTLSTAGLTAGDTDVSITIDGQTLTYTTATGETDPDVNGQAFRDYIETKANELGLNVTVGPFSTANDNFTITSNVKGIDGANDITNSSIPMTTTNVATDATREVISFDLTGFVGGESLTFKADGTTGTTGGTNVTSGMDDVTIIASEDTTETLTRLAAAINDARDTANETHKWEASVSEDGNSLVITSKLDGVGASGLDLSTIFDSTAVPTAFGLTETDTAAVSTSSDSDGITTETTADALIGLKLDGLKDLGEGELTSEIANEFMSVVDTALNQINIIRSDFGSTQNQLDSFVRNAMTTQTNIKAAESVIRDVDYAAESANFNKQNIIAQAGTYAMSQANAVQQNVMRLLQ